MSQSSGSSASAGLGIGGLVFVILLVGKLAGFFANIGWFWVISSIIWAPVIAFIVVLVFLGGGALLIAGGATAFDKIKDSRYQRRLLKEQKKRERLVK